MSSHYSNLLAEREAQIERLEAKETSLQRTLDDKVSSETNLKQERRRLINVSLAAVEAKWTLTLCHENSIMAG